MIRAGNHGMASSLASRDALPPMQPTLSSIQAERMGSRAMRRSVPTARGSDASDFCRPAFGDGVLAACLLALVGIVVIGGLLMLFSWVTATLPTSQLIACPE